MKPTIGTIDGGDALEVNLDRLVAGRALVCANSGAGKSWALRRLLEETHGSIQQLVIDPEGEFYTLRERFDYVLAGRGGDCAAEPRSAALLARRLLELGVSAILDLYELAPRERVRFVGAFVEALVDAPKTLWHPALVVIDEAHAFAPEKGHGEAASTEAVARLMAQGRKRGFAGILATQRLAKLAKDVAAEANNLLVGRASLDGDLRRACDTLGMGKPDWPRIRSLRPGHFFAFGPALCPEVAEVTVGEILTSHPRAGATAAPPAPPRAAVQRVLAELADLPAEAEAEARTADELRAQIGALQRELIMARGVKEPSAERAKAREEGYGFGVEDATDAARQTIARIVASANAGRERAARAIDEALGQLKVAADALRETIDVPEFSVGGADARSDTRDQVAGRMSARRESRQHTGRTLQRSGSHAHPAPTDGIHLRSGAARMLSVLAQHFPKGLREGQWAALCGLKRSGGTWSTYKSDLRGAGYMRDEHGLFYATEAGVAAAGVVPETPRSSDEVLELWRTKPGMRPVIPLVQAVLESRRRTLGRAELAEQVGLTASGGTFSTYLSRARTAELLADGGDGLVLGDAFDGVAP